MNESIKVHYEVEKQNETGISRKYNFSHPYAAPADETLASLEEIKQYLLIRIAEMQNAQAAQAGQVPTIDQDDEESSQGVSHGN